MKTKKKVLFICTGNACRSQIAEGLFRHFGGDGYEVYSAGTHPSRVHPLAIEVMREIGIDISNHTSDPIQEFLGYGIDYVITLCDTARQLCPTFPGKAKKIHWSIKDPFRSWEKDAKRIGKYRKARDEIQKRIEDFMFQI